MSKKTKALHESAEAKTEQAPRDVTITGTVERVQFSPVDKLEDLAKSGFCTERLVANDLASPLFRLCCEVTNDDVESLPQPITPFMSAEQLADIIQGATLLHPMIVQVVKSRHPQGEEKVVEE